MSENKALVKNASDKEQVKKAEKQEKFDRNSELKDLQSVLSTPQGRRVLWRVMEKCKAFGSCYDRSGSQAYYNIGRQDLGHFIMSEIVEAGEDFLFTMMTENKNRIAKQGEI